MLPGSINRSYPPRPLRSDGTCGASGDGAVSGTAVRVGTGLWSITTCGRTHPKRDTGRRQGEQRWIPKGGGEPFCALSFVEFGVQVQR